MDQWTKVLAAKPGNLSLIPGTHTTEGKNKRPQAVLWPPHTAITVMGMLSPLPHTYTHILLLHIPKYNRNLLKCLFKRLTSSISNRDELFGTDQQVRLQGPQHLSKTAEEYLFLLAAKGHINLLYILSKPLQRDGAFRVLWAFLRPPWRMG